VGIAHAQPIKQFEQRARNAHPEDISVGAWAKSPRTAVLDMIVCASDFTTLQVRR
jgi:hypothetical protein